MNKLLILFLSSSQLGKCYQGSRHLKKWEPMSYCIFSQRYVLLHLNALCVCKSSISNQSPRDSMNKICSVTFNFIELKPCQLMCLK